MFRSCIAHEVYICCHTILLISVLTSDVRLKKIVPPLLGGFTTIQLLHCSKCARSLMQGEATVRAHRLQAACKGDDE